MEEQRKIKEEKQKKINEIKEKEMGLYQKKTKEIRENLEKSKSCSNIQSLKKQNYSFFKMEKDFQKKQENELNKIKFWKKSQLSKLEDITEVRKRIAQSKILAEKNAHEKTKLLKQIWKERKEILPAFKGRSLEKCEEDLKKEKEKLEKEKNEKELRLKQKIEYEKVFVPKVKANEYIKNMRENNIKNTIQNLQGKKRIEFIQQHRPPKLVDNLSQNVKKRSSNKKPTSEIRSPSANNPLIKSPLDKINSKNTVKKTSLSPNKINYLQEFREKGLVKSRQLINWDKEIKNDKGKAIENLQVVQKNAEYLGMKAMQKKELVKINGWYAGGQNVGEEVSDLLINSIQGKLQVIKALQEG